MNVIRHISPQFFHDAVHDFLMEAELLNNVVIGLLSRMVHQKETFGDDVFLVHVETNRDEVVAAAMIVRQGVLLSRITDKAAIPVIVGAFAEYLEQIVDVVGEPDDSDRFAELWQQECDVIYHTMMNYGYYQLTRVTPPDGVSGHVRLAAEKDFELLVNWLIQFSHDTGHDLNHDRADAEANIRRKLDQPILGGIRIWMDSDQPVSMAAATRELPNGGNISLVYTPKHLRGRGYASAVTAAVSQEILDAGKSFCCLATDMANLTSNKIYQAIGYQFTGNHRRIKFEYPS